MWPTSIGPAHILGGGTKFETFFCVCVGPLRFFTGGPSNGIKRVDHVRVFHPKL